MTESIHWLKSIQSIGRGFRPGMEIQMLSGGTGTGKSVILDIESDTFAPWRETMRPHYAEYLDYATGEKYWKKFSRRPGAGQQYTALRMIRCNEDGTYSYVKNRIDGELGSKVPEEEIMWIILKAGG